MTVENSIIISLTLYKLVSLLVGLFSIYLGYRLFVKGVWGNSGNLDAEFKGNRLTLKNAAPGTFFALFGVVIISFTLWKGLEFNKYTPHNSSNYQNGTRLDGWGEHGEGFEGEAE